MGKINVGRWLLAGLVTSIVIDVIEGILNGVVLAPQWVDIAKAINQPPLGPQQIVLNNIYGLIIGFSAAFIYAAIRPRFGAGPLTAVWAAAITWVLGYLIADATPTIMGALPWSMMLTLVLVGAVEIVVAMLADAWFYRE